MNIEQLIADLRARVNPQYYDQIGTESYERHQCVLALESLLARIDILREENAALRAAADHSEQALEKVAPDCLTCANLGRINGLSQESYCDSCIYQGRDWRQNHFVDARKMADAVNRRCEACAILPCSCK